MAGVGGSAGATLAALAQRRRGRVAHPPPIRPPSPSPPPRLPQGHGPHEVVGEGEPEQHGPHPGEAPDPEQAQAPVARDGR